MILLRSVFSKIAMGISTPFGATGGTAPYTFSVVAGGVGGTISAEGVYKAPYKVGRDTIKVVDSLGEEATAVIFSGTVFHLLGYIIQLYMGLTDKQIFLFNQKIDPIKDSDLYVSIAPLTGRAFSNVRKYKSDSGLSEIVSVSMLAPVDITLQGRTIEAFYRKEEIIQAMGSTISEQIQNANSFSIGKTTNSVVPLNQEEGASIPYLFNTMINIKYVSSKEKPAMYFDTFQGNEIITNP